MQRSCCLLLFVLVCRASAASDLSFNAAAAPTAGGELAALASPEQGAAAGASSTQPLDLLAVERERSGVAHEQLVPRQARQILGAYPYGGYGYGYLGGYRPFYRYYPHYSYYYPRYGSFYPSFGYGSYYPSFGFGYGYPKYFYG